MILLILSLLNVPEVAVLHPPQLASPPIDQKHRAGASRAKGDLVRLFSEDDYPKSALLLEQEGTVAVLLTVGTAGLPTRCEIKTSSGFGSLDAATCRILMERARFVPARDRRGRPVIDHYSQRVTWRTEADEIDFPTSPPVPPVAFVNWQSSATFAVSDAGIGTCTLTDDNTPTPFRIGTCADLVDSVRDALVNWTPKFPTPYSVRFSLKWSVGDKPNFGETKTTNLFRRAVALRIDSAGFLIGCNPVGDVDTIKLALLCNRARSAPFDPRPSESGAANAERHAVLVESADVYPGL